MSEQNIVKQSLGTLLTSLCDEALAEESESNPSVVFYTRAPEGKTIAEQSTTISLNSRAFTLFQDIVTRLRMEKRLRFILSKKELEQEVITSLFEGTEALQESAFNVDALVNSLLNRLAEGGETWDIYLPIENLKLPKEEQISLAGGIFKSLTNGEKELLRDECMKIWNQAKWRVPQQAESGIQSLNEDFDEILTSSGLWYQIQVSGRQQAAKNQAIEAAVLAMDILSFFALLNEINPEVFASHFPHQGKRGIMKSIQMARGQRCGLDFESGIPFPYTLDSSQYRKLTKFKEFQQIQQISNSSNPNPVEQRFLLGVQQYAEATRLPSLSAKLVWYLSALETVLVKEDEGDRHKKVEKRVRKLLGETAAKTVVPLYDKRRKPVHYGYRNRVGEEFITETDIHEARSLGYLGINLALRHSYNFTEVSAFLGHIDSLPETSQP